MTGKFDHAINDRFVILLQKESEKRGWWADVLADSNLFIALRGSYMNVYWRGQSLFCIEAGAAGLTVSTHEKYLVDPTLASQVSLIDGTFQVERLLERGFIRHYEGPVTIEKMKSAASLFSGSEKTGCHEIAIRNPTVIDCEIAFPGVVSPSEDGEKKSAPRVDLACLEPDGADARLVFWEAKHYNNAELRAANNTPAVCGQVTAYRSYLRTHSDEILASYTKVAKNLVEISVMGKGRPVSQLIYDVGTGKRHLTLGDKPKVGLIIFGFDVGQRDDAGWKKHLKVLEEKIIDVRAIGDAKQIRI